MRRSSATTSEAATAKTVVACWRVGAGGGFWRATCVILHVDLRTTDDDGVRKSSGGVRIDDSKIRIKERPCFG